MRGMVSAHLVSVRLKIDRARNHFDHLSAAIHEAMRAKQNSNVSPFEFDGERNHLLLRAVEPRPLDQMVPLAIGDSVHNLRSALDHIVFQLAAINGAPAEAGEKTAFPIYSSPKGFKDFAKKSLAPFISAEALTAIAKLQPYEAGNGGPLSVLWMLSQLDNVDKHRIVVVVAQKVRPYEFTITRFPTGEMFNHVLTESEWKPLEHGTELIRFNLSQLLSAPGKVHLKVETTGAVLFDDPTLVCNREIVISVLHEFFRVVTGIVDSFGKAFFGE
jgi:hypothetical protein